MRGSQHATDEQRPLCSIVAEALTDGGFSLNASVILDRSVALGWPTRNREHVLGPQASADRGHDSKRLWASLRGAIHSVVAGDIFAYPLGNVSSGFSPNR